MLINHYYKDMERSRSWCFTINNYSVLDIDVCDTVVCEYIIYGREIGEHGTPHLQGYIRVKNAKTLRAMKTYFHPNAHLEMAKTVKEAIEYCKKDGDWTERGTAPMTQEEKGLKGKAAIEARWNLAKAGLFEDLPPEQIKTYEYIFRKNLEVEDRGTLDNLWIQGPSGCGKSSFVRQEHAEFYSKPMSKWWDGYNHEDVVLLDDFDPTHATFLSYFLKIWTDHYAFNAEVKGGMLKIRPKKFIVTSQYRMDQCFPDPETLAAIRRRFQVMDMFPDTPLMNPRLAECFRLE